MESNVNKLEVNFFEYCIIEEKTYLPAETVKVRIPKLTTNTNDVIFDAKLVKTKRKRKFSDLFFRANVLFAPSQ